MKETTKKLIAPIVITVLVILYFVFYMSIGLYISRMPWFIRFLIFIIPVCFIVVMVYMLFERIGEIRGGEEDDLSKY